MTETSIPAGFSTLQQRGREEGEAIVGQTGHRAQRLLVGGSFQAVHLGQVVFRDAKARPT